MSGREELEPEVTEVTVLASKEQEDASVSAASLHPEFPFCHYFWTEREREFQVQLHWHKDLEILVLEKGRFVLNSANKPQVVKGPAVVLVPAWCIHGMLVPPDGRAQIFTFDADMLALKSGDERLDECLKLLQSPDLNELILRKGDVQFTTIFSAASALALRCREVHSPTAVDRLIVKAELIKLLAWCSQSPYFNAKDLKQSEAVKAQQERLKSLLSYVAEHFAYPIGIEDAVRACGLSKSYFSEYFTRTVGMSFSDYLLRLRLKHASQYLSNSNMPIEQAALKSGFENKSYFHKCFKQLFGCTPLQYRKSRRMP